MLNNEIITQDKRVTHEIQRLIMRLHTLKEPNSTFERSYTVEPQEYLMKAITDIRQLCMPVKCHIYGTILYVDETNKRQLDRILTEPPKVEKRFRDIDGKLTMPVKCVAKKTLAEAESYYKSGELYLTEGKVWECIRDTGSDFVGNQIEQIRFICGEYTTFYNPEYMGTYLPDVASEGREVIALHDDRLKDFYPLPERKRPTREHSEPETER